MTALYEQMVFRPSHGQSVPQWGSLLVSQDGIVFYGKEKVVNFGAIRRLSLDSRGWLHIEYGDNRQAAISDGSWRGKINRLTRLPALLKALHRYQG
ncbi:hypothetical protein KUV89_00420 [Marinobacter hydrocarbonoclasticus]|nr:hypothetical protein [Marinobacter nauticus]